MKNTMMAAMAIFLIATIGCSESTTPTAKNPSSGSETADKPAATTGSSSTAAAVAPVVTPAKAPVVGEEVPEITGPDIDGEVFNLSDYRGKVVMIDFWGDW